MNQMRRINEVNPGYVNKQIAAAFLNISVSSLNRLSAAGFLDRAKQVIGNRYFYNPKMLPLCYAEFLKFRYKRKKEVFLNIMQENKK